MFFSRSLVLLLALLAANISFADDKEAEQAIRSSLSVFLPKVKADSITPTRVPGLYEVVLGSRLIYMTQDGRYLLQGSLFDLEKNEDITAPRRDVIKAEAVEAVGAENMLIYEPEKARYTVSVFTDIDCGYCRKLHAEMDKYLAQGIRIRYLFYPRAGENSVAYNKAEAVWCAKDRKAAMTAAKSGQDIPMSKCENPVNGHYQLGQQLGVRGTPSMILESGEMIPGYVPAEKLAAALAERLGGK